MWRNSKFFMKIRNEMMMMSHVSLLMQYSVWSLGWNMRQKMKLKGIQIGKEEVKESSFAYVLIKEILKISPESSDAWYVLYKSSEKQNQRTETHSFFIDQWQIFWARYSINDNLSTKPSPTQHPGLSLTI